jgi:hypothetical protein
MSRLLIVLMCGTFVLTIPWDLLWSDTDMLTDPMTDCSHVIVPKSKNAPYDIIAY